MTKRAGIDKNRIIDTAVEMVNNEGADALSLNRLASKLGIKPPSLYNHIKGLPHLMTELSILNTQKMAGYMTDAALGKSGSDAIYAIAYAYRKYIKDNPGLYMITLRSSNNQQTKNAELQNAEKKVVSIVQAVIAPYGLSDEDALHVIRGFRSMVHGFTTIEIAGGFGLPLDCNESFNRLIDMLIMQLAGNN